MSQQTIAPPTVAPDPAPPPDGTLAADEALAERLVTSTIGALELFSIHIGRTLGLYDLLDRGPVTAAKLADRAGIAPRYAREWLGQQAVAGLLDASEGDREDSRTYRIPAQHRGVLLEPTDLAHAAPLADMIAGIAGVLDRLPAAFRTGDGVPYADYGPAFRHGQGAVNRPVFAHDLPRWLRELTAVPDRLDGTAVGRIADVGCGVGWSTIALAEALPAAFVDGYDSDAASIQEARRHAADAGVGDRVSFHVADAAGATALAGPYDLVLIFEALHDMARPVEALREARAALGADGVVVVADERVAERFTAPGDEVERLMWGWSITHCLPTSLAESPSAALGTALRPASVHRLARRAGFASSRELPVEHAFFRLYLMTDSPSSPSPRQGEHP